MKSHPDRRRQTGRLGEEQAALFLERRGYGIVERNWRCRSGELDLVVGSGTLLVFVEVRTRTSIGRFGTPAESVERRKQMQVRQTAQVYLSMKGIAGRPIRFDVIAVVLEKDESVRSIDHYENAF